MTKLTRIVRHLSLSSWQLRRCFGPALLDTIEHAIRAGEQSHGAQLCFAVEGALSGRALLAGTPARERAIEVFSRLRVWDTEHNNGVLIYLLLAERDVEIVADRGISARVAPAQWEAICHTMEAAFRQGQFEQGSLAGIAALTQLLQQHYPANGTAKPNELADRPVVW
ncbi:TPM domain-containing protein [Craterilacuibacter sp. RT1T]|uniref:TPM domain-containing protein n=1 Tax=Craterilacuibacter sp. RT1T TaxID=2942211 RepID=UPI0020BD8713|nr:TPM domain-containing protein [Craterilacuibacter sp. RT1T]MCL6262828.1 TPM domain-containing protein [Craterilacuibacter sp. RT1T]